MEVKHKPPLAITSYHNDDNFISFLRERMNTLEQHLFIESFKMYLQHGRNEKSFVVNLDDIWEKIGFTRKNNCRRVLEKNFEIGKHYIINTIVENFASQVGEAVLNIKETDENEKIQKNNEFINNNDEKLASQVGEASFSINDTVESKKHGGHNKEIILMSVKTFKKLCMISQTSKAEIVQEYYLKMEEILQDYMEKIIQEEKIEKQKLLTDLSITKEKAFLERHQALLTGFSHMKLVYMIHMFDMENGKYVIKLGRTDDLRDRVNHIGSSFKVKPRVIDVFTCENNHEFEQYLHNHHKFIPFKYSDPINGKVSTETYLVNNEQHYQKFKKTIEKEKYQFEHRSVEELKYLTEMKKLDLITKIIDIYGNNPEKIEKILTNSISITIINKNSFVDKEEISAEQNIESYSEETVEQKIPLEVAAEEKPEITINKSMIRGKMVQIYVPSDLTKVVRLFDCIGDALREIKGANHTSIKFSARNHIVYCGYRWYFVNRDDPNPNSAKNIGNTIDIQERTTGFVARLNMDKTIVLNVYKNQVEACNEVGLQKSLMSNAVKFGSPLSGNFWILWEHIDKEMQDKYLKNNQLPIPPSNPRGTSVQKIHPETKEILEEFDSLERVRINLGITTKTLKKYSISQTKYKGFLWKIL